MSDERQAALAKFLKQRRGYLVDIESFNAGWQAAILAERERLAKAQDKRAAELDDDADFYHRKGDAHESIERRVRARDLRKKFEVEG